MLNLYGNLKKHVASIIIVSLLALFSLVAIKKWEPNAGALTIPVEGTEMYGAINTTLQLVNEYRAEHNKEALKLDSGLTEIAMERAYELFMRDDHTSPNGGGSGEKLRAAGVSRAVLDSEVVGVSTLTFSTSDSAAANGVQMFRNSADHAAILRHSAYTHIGIGVVSMKGEGTTYCYILTDAAMSGNTSVSSSNQAKVKEIEVIGQYASLSMRKSIGTSAIKYGDSGVFQVQSGPYNGKLKQKANVPISKVSLTSSDPGIIQVNNAGQYKVVGTGNVTITATLANGISGSTTFSIERTDIKPSNYIIYLDGVKNLKYHTVMSAYNFPYEYTGTPVKPTITIYDSINEIWLTEGKDFAVAYSKDTNEGKTSVESTITITGINGYTGTKTCWYQINAPEIKSFDVTCPETLELGTKGKIEVTVHPMDFEGAYYIHNLSTEVIDIDEKGVITPKAAGTARIQVQASNSSVLAEKEIEVVWAKNQGGDMGGSGTTSSSSTETGSATTSGSSATTGKTMIWTYTSGTGWHWQEEETSQTNQTSKAATNKLENPTVTGASNVSNGIKVTWKDSSNVKGYYILRKSGKGNWSKIATVKAGVRSYIDKKAKNGTKYSYTVQSYSASTKSGYDKTGKTAYRLTNIKISSAKYKKSCKVVVKWKKNAKATGYQIQYSTKKNFSNAKTLTVKGAGKSSYTISKLSKNTKYYVRVRAYYNKSSVKSYTSWSGTKTAKVKK